MQSVYNVTFTRVGYNPKIQTRYCVTHSQEERQSVKTNTKTIQDVQMIT